MLNPLPCIIWPLALLGAFVAYRLWTKRRDRKASWLGPLSLYIGFLLLLWWVALVVFGKYWVDGLLSLYIPQ